MVALREREVRNEQVPQPSIAAMVVFDQKMERVLLVRHSSERKDGMVGFPGGRPILGSDESITQAGIRELREETGLRTTADNLIGFPGNIYLGFMRRESKDFYYVLQAFIVRDYEGELKRKTPEGKVFWADIAKLDRFGSRLSPTVKTVVSDSLRYLKTTR